jgi:hypothetical protein
MADFQLPARAGTKSNTPQTHRFAASAFSGGDRDRTDDLFHAMEALYQLSYAP